MVNKTTNEYAGLPSLSFRRRMQGRVSLSVISSQRAGLLRQWRRRNLLNRHVRLSILFHQFIYPELPKVVWIGFGLRAGGLYKCLNIALPRIIDGYFLKAAQACGRHGQGIFL